MSTLSSKIRLNLIPPLQSGDRMSRDEFERRFDATPGLKKAELIEGVVYMPPPVSFDFHAAPHLRLANWLGTYESYTHGVRGGNDGSMRLDMKNMPQPDLCLMIEKASGGQAEIDADGYLVGAPELIAEISASSVSIDLHDKLETYRRAGAKEYIVWRTYDQAIDFFILRGNRYEPLSPGNDGIFRSESFPGLWLAPSPLLAGNMLKVQEILRQGLESPEHSAFVARLAHKQK